MEEEKRYYAYYKAAGRKIYLSDTQVTVAYAGLWAGIGAAMAFETLAEAKKILKEFKKKVIVNGGYQRYNMQGKIFIGEYKENEDKTTDLENDLAYVDVTDTTRL